MRADYGNWANQPARARVASEGRATPQAGQSPLRGRSLGRLSVLLGASPRQNRQAPSLLGRVAGFARASPRQNLPPSLAVRRSGAGFARASPRQNLPPHSSLPPPSLRQPCLLRCPALAGYPCPRWLICPIAIIGNHTIIIKNGLVFVFQKSVLIYTEYCFMFCARDCVYRLI